MSETDGRLRVIIESPFAAETPEQRIRNDDYLAFAMLDSIRRGEAPFASHRLYTRALRDSDLTERKLGMACGFAWLAVAQLVAVYEDLGLSPGMEQGIAEATRLGKTIVFRKAEGWK